MLNKLIEAIRRWLGFEEKVALAMENDHLIVSSDNAGEQGQPVEDQDPLYIPRGVAP